jgi:hypothetical protein
MFASWCLRYLSMLSLCLLALQATTQTFTTTR